VQQVIAGTSHLEFCTLLARRARTIGVLAGLLAVLIGAPNAIAGPAGSANLQDQYQTRGIVLTDWNMAEWAAAGYWEQKIGPVLELTLDPRMQADADERDAVLATIWQLKPAAITAEAKFIAIIPKRASKPASKDIAYQITFAPRTGTQKRDSVEARFIADGLGAKPFAIFGPPGKVHPLPTRYAFAGFPQNNVANYWAQHPGELQTILSWLSAAAASTTLSQILNINVVEGPARRSTYFHVAATKLSTGAVRGLSIMRLGEAKPVVSELPPQYGGLDFADLQLERFQSGADPKVRDRLGVITGLADLPVTERFPAKFAIVQYFGRGARNTEIDAIVPVPDSQKRALLTFRFMAGNNVSVRRIGEAGKASMPGRLGDVRQVNGFGANATTLSALTGWLKKRYPAVKPAGATVDELEKAVTAEIQKRSGTPAWFRENYGIEIVAASAARTQIPSSLQLGEQELAGLRDFTPAELQMLEIALEKIGDRLLVKLKGLQIARQKISVAMIGVTSKKLAVSDPAEAGVAILRAKDRLIVMFDSVSLNSDSLFVGGLNAAGQPAVADSALWAFAHELGHMLARTPGVSEAFDELVRAKEIKPVTWYSATNPKTEFIAEAFALYVADPEWLKNSRPDLFGWFEAL
jgi:hypothetical protein